MERAVKTIAKLRMSQDPTAMTEVVKRAWNVAVGKRIGSHAKAIALVRSTLVVEVEDFIWQKQLFTLSRPIIEKLGTLLGPDVIDDVEFRVGVPRRMPQREERAAHSQPKLWDDADDIRDPVLRHVYKSSRQRALA
jgi:hypothetical protein